MLLVGQWLLVINEEKKHFVLFFFLLICFIIDDIQIQSTYTFNEFSSSSSFVRLRTAVAAIILFLLLFPF